jgi:hypothetical protein
MLKAVLMDQPAVTYRVKHGRRKWRLMSVFLSGKSLIISGRNGWLSCGIAIFKIASSEGGWMASGQRKNALTSSGLLVCVNGKSSSMHRLKWQL